LQVAEISREYRVPAPLKGALKTPPPDVPTITAIPIRFTARPARINLAHRHESRAEGNGVRGRCHGQHEPAAARQRRDHEDGSTSRPRAAQSAPSTGISAVAAAVLLVSCR